MFVGPGIEGYKYGCYGAPNPTPKGRNFRLILHLQSHLGSDNFESEVIRKIERFDCGAPTSFDLSAGTPAFFCGGTLKDKCYANHPND